MKKLLMGLMFVLVTVGGVAMIMAMELGELVKEAEVIVKGDVVAVKAFEANDEGAPYQVLANLFEVTDVIKGEIEVGAKIKIKTYAGIEDLATLGATGTYLVFLTKQEKYYEIFAPPQGCWPVLADGSFGGMGVDTSYEQIKKMAGK